MDIENDAFEGLTEGNMTWTRGCDHDDSLKDE